MCDPVSLTVTGLVVTAAAGGMTAYGQYAEGQSKNKYYQYLADENEREANALEKTAENQVTLVQDKAAKDAKDLKNSTAKIAGTQKAAMAAAGIYGVTAEDIEGDTFNKSKLDEANIRYNADIESWNVNTEANEQANVLRSQAGLYKFAGKEAKRAAGINMTSTLLGTAGSMFLMGGALSGAGKGGSSTITGGKGGKVIDTQQFGKTWSPYKLN